MPEPGGLPVGARVDWSRSRLTDAQWRDVIRLAQKRGARHASDMTGIEAKKIRKMARQYGTSVQAKPSDLPEPKREELKEKADDRRLMLKHKLLDRAHDLVDRMGETYTIVTRDGEQIDLARPPARETKDLAIAMGIVADKMRLEMGEATSRTESISRDQVDDELMKLANELSEKAAQREMDGVVGKLADG